MSFLLDTNILSAHLRRPSGLSHRFVQHSGRLYTSSLCLAELFVWAHARPDPTSALAAVGHLLHFEVSVIDFDQDCAEHFGKLRVDLRRHGIEVNTVDLMIASVALLYDLPFVTHNTSDFEKIPNLLLQDWLSP